MMSMSEDLSVALSLVLSGELSYVDAFGPDSWINSKDLKMMQEISNFKKVIEILNLPDYPK